MNLWVVEQQVKMDVSIWDAVHSHSMGVSAEWSRCLGSMARCARDSVAPLRQSSAGWMPAKIGRLFAGVGRRRPVTIRKASLMAGQWGRCEHRGTRQERSTLLLNGPGWGGCSQSCCCSTPARRFKSAIHDVNYLRSDLRYQRYVTVLSNIPLMYVGSEKKGRVLLFWLTFSSRLSSLLLR